MGVVQPLQTGPPPPGQPPHGSCVCLLCVCLLCVSAVCVCVCWSKICVIPRTPRPSAGPLRRTPLRQTPPPPPPDRPSAGPPLRRTAQNFALFFLLHPHFHSFFLSLGIFSCLFFSRGLPHDNLRAKTSTFERPKHTKIPREDPQRGKKRTNFAAEQGKTSAKFLGPPPFGAPPFRAPPFRGPTLF